MISFLKLIFIFFKKSKEKLPDVLRYSVLESLILLYISLIDKVRLSEMREFMGPLLRFMVDNIEVYGELIPGIALLVYVEIKLVNKLPKTVYMGYFKISFYSNYALSFIYSILRYVGLVSNTMRIRYPWAVLILAILCIFFCLREWRLQFSGMNKIDLIRCAILTLMPPVILIGKDCP